MSTNQKIRQNISDAIVEQLVVGSFINGTLMCLAYDKKIDSWLCNQDTLDLFCALAEDLKLDINPSSLSDLDVTKMSTFKYQKLFPGLIFTKAGSPESGGGTWIHPDLSILLGAWCSVGFINQFHGLIKYQRNKQEGRIDMFEQITASSEKIRHHDNEYYSGLFFNEVHDSLNISLTTETCSQMKARLSKELEREVEESDLVINHFSITMLEKYVRLWNTTAYFIVREGLHPLIAAKKAVDFALPANYEPSPID